MAEGGGIQW
jgi:hypothetical protein